MSPKLPIANTATQKLGETAKARVTPIDRKEKPPLVDPTPINAAKPARNDNADGDLLIARFLRTMQVQLRSMGLYERNHPRLTENLELAQRDLRAVFVRFPGFGVRIEDGIFYLTTRSAEMPPATRNGPRGGRPQLPPIPPRSNARNGRALADKRGELRGLAEELGGAGIESLVFLPQANLGELASFVHTVDATCRARKLAQSGNVFVEPDWPTWITAHGLTGIRINSSLGPGHDAVLASLLGAVLARETANASSAAVTKSTREQVQRTLQFLSVAGQHLDQAQRDSTEDAARAVQSELAGADPQVLDLLAHRVANSALQDGDSPGTYFSRIGDELASEFVRGEFMSGRIQANEIRLLFAQLYRDSERKTEIEAAFEARIEQFWSDVPAREVARTLASADAWCIPISVLRRHLEPLIAADEMRNATASGREARRSLENYIRCLNSEETKARRAVAAALVEMSDLLARLWPHPQLPDLARTVVAALGREASPSIAGLLVAATENLARIGLEGRGYAEIEGILEDLDKAPRETDHGHIEALARRIVAQEQWLNMVDESLAKRPLDPALPRLLCREPQRLVDRLGLLLTAPGGGNALPAMARLVQAAGEAVIGTLDAQLREPRRQRVATAIKLLSAVQPLRLATALPQVLAGWDWTLQDLAVSELSRQPNAELRAQAAKVFLPVLAEAHLFVVPSMIDQIALAGETAGIPQLWAIAAGDVEQLRDIFIRIKAVEALGRLRAHEAADLFRNMVRQREGLTHAEPAGLRAAAQEALALVENQPGSARLRAAQDAVKKVSVSFAVPRRYMRVTLDSPLPTKIAAPHQGVAQVRSLALGGALIETATPLAVGDSIRVEIRMGLRRVSSTAVVRNVSMAGYGIEFMHMNPEDRELLRRHLHKLLI